MGRNRVKSADPFCKDRTRVLAFRTLKSKTGKEYNEAPKEDELDSRGMSKTQQRFSRDLQRQMLLSGKKKHLTHEELKEINDFKKAQREKKEKQERAKVKIHNFETEMREGESLRSFQRRLELEKRRVLIAEAPKLKTLSAKKKAHLNKKKAEKKERERLKREEEELDKRYEPQYETVPFGEVVDRPPTFDVLPTNNKAKTTQAVRMSELAALLAGKSGGTIKVAQKPATTSSDADDVDEEEEEEEEDGETKTSQQATQARRPLSFLERQELIAKAREAQRLADVAKAREDAQTAYREMRNKKMHGHKGMASLAQGAGALNAGVHFAQTAIRSVDRAAKVDLSGLR